MKKQLLLLCMATFVWYSCQTSQKGTSFDWLLTPRNNASFVQLSENGQELTIGNRLVTRTFRLDPTLATISMKNLMTDEEMIRAVSPEGYLYLNGEKYAIGGLTGQKERGYLRPEWVDEMKPVEGSFLLKGYEEGEIQERFPWARSRWALNKENATGKTVTFVLQGQEPMEHLQLRLTFGIYDHLPVISKSFELVNEGDEEVRVDSFELEQLAFVEPESSDDAETTDLLPNIHVESNHLSASCFKYRGASGTATWKKDPAYTSQRSYTCATRCILSVHSVWGPDQLIPAGGSFTSFTNWLMPFDSYDRERKGLFQRRFYRALAPWTTENPIFLHLTSNNPEVIHTAVDQCAETGYEMIIMSFGCGLNAEDVSPENIAFWKSQVDYAHSKGIEMGCYSLLSSRHINDENDCINYRTGKPGGMRFGYSPCLQSQWGIDYFDHIEKFITETGMTCLEHDGSYASCDYCASTTHPGHRGLHDSQWEQYWKIAHFYQRMCAQGVYLNVPDFYFMNGSTKVGIGYKEVNWSLPRENQIFHTRQLNNDCTYERPQSGCWSFVPLTQYHGGGAAATIEPLSEHLDVYKMLMFQNYSAGVQACYRGPRLYDTEETKQAVIDIISWYKQYREILNSDIIHLRKCDARDWDGMLHVNPDLKEKGLAIFYNPLSEPITRTINLPLYYTGLTKTARIREQEGKTKKYRLNRDYSVDLTVEIPANGYTWYVIE